MKSRPSTGEARPARAAAVRLRAAAAAWVQGLSSSPVDQHDSAFRKLDQALLAAAVRYVRAAGTCVAVDAAQAVRRGPGFAAMEPARRRDLGRQGGHRSTLTRRRRRLVKAGGNRS